VRSGRDAENHEEEGGRLRLAPGLIADTSIGDVARRAGVDLRQQAGELGIVSCDRATASLRAAQGPVRLMQTLERAGSDATSAGSKRKAVWLILKGNVGVGDAARWIHFDPNAAPERDRGPGASQSQSAQQRES